MRQFIIQLLYITCGLNLKIDYSPSAPIWTNNKCESGSNQSPINLPQDLNKFQYSDSISLISTNYSKISNPTIKSINDGEKISFVSESLGYILFNYFNNTYKYDAFEINFHIPSEHLIGGVQAPLEVQINHTKDLTYTNSTNNAEDQNGDNHYLIISLFFLDKDKYTSEFIRSFTNFRGDKESLTPSAVGQDIESFNIMNLNTVVLSHKMFFYYKGSMTLPPCNEGVHWLIQNHYLYLSSLQYSVLKDLIGQYYNISEGNRRAIQMNENVDQGKIYALYNQSISINIMFTYSSFIQIGYSILLFPVLLFF